MKTLAIISAAVLLATFIGDFFLHQHEYFGVEDFPGFYGAVAICGGLLVVGLGRLLAPLLRVKPRNGESS